MTDGKGQQESVKGYYKLQLYCGNCLHQWSIMIKKGWIAELSFGMRAFVIYPEGEDELAEPVACPNCGCVKDVSKYDGIIDTEQDKNKELPSSSGEDDFKDTL